MNAHQFIFIAVLVPPCAVLVHQFVTGALESPEQRLSRDISRARKTGARE